MQDVKAVLKSLSTFPRFSSDWKLKRRLSEEVFT